MLIRPQDFFEFRFGSVIQLVHFFHRKFKVCCIGDMVPLVAFNIRRGVDEQQTGYRERLSLAIPSSFL